MILFNGWISEGCPTLGVGLAVASDVVITLLDVNLGVGLCTK